MSDTRLRSCAWVGLALVCALYLGRLGGFVLQDPDEGRYAEIPREMIESGDWVTPRLNYVKYFEKPPLLYWLVGSSFVLLGQSEGAARLVPALAGIATLLVTYALGCAMLGRRAALIGGALLATSPLFFVLSQVLVIDMLLTACTTATLAALWAAHRAQRKGPWTVEVAAAAALGVLAKGPVALVLPGAIAVAFLALRRDLATLRALLRPAPIAAFAAIALPWFVLVSLRNPEFPEFFFVREHLQRFATDRVGHPEGPLYYVPVLLGGPLPWTLLAAVLAASAAGRAAFGSLAGDARLLLGLWAAVVFAFFSAASSKLAPYVLPALPPLALLAGGWIDRLIDDRAALRAPLRAAAWLLVALGGLCLVVGPLGLLLAGVAAPRFDVEPAALRAIAGAAAWGGLALLPAGLLCLRELDAQRRSAAVALALLVVGLGGALLGAVGGRAVAKSSRGLAAAIDRETADGAAYRVVAYRRLMQSLSFYTGGRVTQLDPAGKFNEIDAGAGWAPDRAEYFWTDPERLASEWRSGKKVFVATDRRYVEQLATLEPAPRILATEGRRVLLVNFPAADAAPDP